MCDYSLHHVASRPAKVGDRLVTSGFNGSATHGFCAVDEPNVAVCLRPGTELAFEADVESHHAIPGALGMDGKVARFTQIDMDNPTTFHDALEFPDGKIVLVTHLGMGQVATVLQLPPETEPEKKAAVAAPELIG